VKRGKKIMLNSLAVLVVLALGLGFWSGWSLLGLMNRLDGVLAGADAHLVVRAQAYGTQARQKLNIWAPAKPVKRDVIVFFYGGSWKMGERDLYDFTGRALAERGYVVVVADYRLVPGVRFPGFVEDGAAAIAWTRTNIATHGGNPDRIFVSGHSAGAHIAAMVTLDQQWLAKAGAPADTIKGFVGLAGPYDFFPFTSDSSRNAFGHLPDPAISQPIHYARADAPPMLLLTGSVDTTVKPRNSRVLSEAITKLGGKAEQRVYDGVDHSGIIMALAKPFRDKAPVIDDMDGFIKSVALPAAPR
jgi:acetyl esterase/lipase